MAHTGYSSLGRRWRRAKGFRLTSAKFSFLRLRLRRLAGLIGLLGRCLELLGRGVGALRSSSSSSSSGGGAGRRCCKSVNRKGLVCQPLGRSNSFYAEAIADCLDFIKRTSVSMDGDAVVTGR